MNDKLVVLLRAQARLHKDAGANALALMMDGAADAIGGLEVELAEARRDAERYRWLRGQDGFTFDRMLEECETVAELDAAIDAARGEP